MPRINPNAPASDATIRLTLASAAMQGLLANDDFVQQALAAIGERKKGDRQRTMLEKIVAGRAVRMADAMIAALNESPVENQK